MGEMDRLQRLRQQQDWFRPAMEATGPLHSCLDQVIRLEDAKLKLVQCLKKNLCSNGASDRVTALRRQIYDFSRTLDMRLGLLSFDRPAAWFRRCQSKDLGPFPGAIHEDPVFLPFDPIQAKVLKVELKTAWTERQAEVRCFGLVSEGCLWLSLLDFNCRWDRLCEFPEPYADLRLDELPEALPDELYSEALQAFLQRVKGAVMACRADLDQCFDRLWKASDPFLAKQFTDALQRQRGHARSHDESARQQQSSDGYRQWANVQDKRLSYSLSFMSFSRIPDKEELKRRFRCLARQFHPDFEGGSEEQFKALNQHYRQILYFLEQHGDQSA
ncbi:MAG: hypothetical protein ACOH5I_07300 [Oligoflexus sp.]